MDDYSVDVFVIDGFDKENGISLSEIKESICKTLHKPNAVVDIDDFGSKVYRVVMRNVEG